jgi:hypothetical protein
MLDWLFNTYQLIKLPNHIQAVPNWFITLLIAILIVIGLFSEWFFVIRGNRSRD